MTFNQSRFFRASMLIRFGASAVAALAFFLFGLSRSTPNSAASRPVVVEVDLNDIVEPLSAEYVTRGVSHANQIHADAVLLELSTPGGLDTSMREIISAIVGSRVPVITYVAPSGHRAASAGFFILLSAASS